MKYYVMQVRTREEQKYIDLFNATKKEGGVNLYFPRRELIERKQGALKKRIRPVFPGYVIVEAEEGARARQHWCLRHIEGFCRFLRSNTEVIEMAGKDLEITLHFAKKIGQIAGVSKVYFNERDQIVVTEGPLAGLEGFIIKVDKRKGRAKIKLDFCNEVFTVDLGFEILDRKNSEKKEGRGGEGL